MGAGDLGAGDGRGAGVRMDLQHRSDLALSGLDQTVKQVAVGGNSMPHRVPTMLRNLAARCSAVLAIIFMKSTSTGNSTSIRSETGQQQKTSCARSACRVLWAACGCSSGSF